MTQTRQFFGTSCRTLCWTQDPTIQDLSVLTFLIRYLLHQKVSRRLSFRISYLSKCLLFLLVAICSVCSPYRLPLSWYCHLQQSNLSGLFHLLTHTLFGFWRTWKLIRLCISPINKYVGNCNVSKTVVCIFPICFLAEPHPLAQWHSCSPLPANAPTSLLFSVM